MPYEYMLIPGSYGHCPLPPPHSTPSMPSPVSPPSATLLCSSSHCPLLPPSFPLFHALAARLPLLPPNCVAPHRQPLRARPFCPRYVGQPPSRRYQPRHRRHQPDPCRHRWASRSSRRRRGRRGKGRKMLSPRGMPHCRHRHCHRKDCAHGNEHYFPHPQCD